MTGNWTLRVAGSAGVALALALAVAGCATPNSAPANGSASASDSSTSSPRPTSTSTATATPIDGQCDTANLAGTIGQGGGGAAGSVEVTIVLTNNGAAQCSLQGWPGVSFVGNGNGTQLGKSAELDRSTPHPTVVLQPGGTAKASLRVTQALNYPEADCGPKPADGFRVYPPGSTASLFVTYPATACSSDSISLLQVGALVAG